MTAWKYCGWMAAGAALLAVYAGCEQPEQRTSAPGALPRADALEPAPRVNATTYFAHAHLMERQGQYERAVEQYNKAIEVSPDFVSARNRLGITLNKLGRNAEASEHFRKAVSASPGEAYLLNNLGFSLYLETKYSEAAEVLEQALALKPTFARARMNYALCLGHTGKMEQAFAEFCKVGSEADAHYNLAIVQTEAGLFADAARSLEAALRLNPGFEAAKTQLLELGRLAAVQPEAEPAGVDPTPKHTMLSPVDAKDNPPVAAAQPTPPTSAQFTNRPRTAQPATVKGNPNHAARTADPAPATAGSNNSASTNNSGLVIRSLPAETTTGTTTTPDTRNTTPTAQTPVAAQANPTRAADAPSARTDAAATAGATTTPPTQPKRVELMPIRGSNSAPTQAKTGSNATSGVAAAQPARTTPKAETAAVPQPIAATPTQSNKTLDVSSLFTTPGGSASQDEATATTLEPLETRTHKTGATEKPTTLRWDASPKPTMIESRSANGLPSTSSVLVLDSTDFAPSGSPLDERPNLLAARTSSDASTTPVPATYATHRASTRAAEDTHFLRSFLTEWSRAISRPTALARTCHMWREFYERRAGGNSLRISAH